MKLLYVSTLQRRRQIGLRRDIGRGDHREIEDAHVPSPTIAIRHRHQGIEQIRKERLRPIKDDAAEIEHNASEVESAAVGVTGR